MCKNNFTNENEFDLYGPITEDGVHYYGFGCINGCINEHATGPLPNLVLLFKLIIILFILLFIFFILFIL